MMTEEQKQALVSRCEKHLELYRKIGFTGLAEEECAEIFAIALAALTQPASQPENIRHDALCDTNYARGVAHGWNLAQNGDSEGMRKCIESRTTAAMSALAQRASPALKLPDVPPNALVALCEQMYDHRSTGAAVAHDVWQDCIEELRVDVPHTAPIEPICATGGAEWVKCSERMPRSNETVQFYVADDKAIKQGRFISDSWHQEQDWCESSYGGMIDSEVCGNVTHWIPLPAAPKP